MKSENVRMQKIVVLPYTCTPFRSFYGKRT